MTRGRFAGIVAGAGAVAFVALAVVAGTQTMPGPLDATAHAVMLDAVGGPSRVPLIQWITWLGNHDTLVAGVTLASVLSLVAGNPWWTVRFLAASGLGGLVVRGLKTGFGRDRPLDGVVEATGWSFPSGHAFGAIVFYGLLVALAWVSTERRDLRAAVVAAGVLVVGAVGLSRVALGVHFVSDVAAGWAVGAAWLALSQWGVDVARDRLTDRRRDWPRV